MDREGWHDYRARAANQKILSQKTVFEAFVERARTPTNHTYLRPLHNLKKKFTLIPVTWATEK